MSNSSSIIDGCISETDKLKAVLKKKSQKQVSSVDEKLLLKAAASAWYNDHREKLKMFGEKPLLNIDEIYHYLLEGSNKNPSRQMCITQLGLLKKEFIQLRKMLMTLPLGASTTEDSPPNFSPLISDVKMQKILLRRWSECSACIRHSLPLAGTVMIGGFIEGLLISKINQEVDQSKIYKAKSAPVDKKTSKAKVLSEWSLSDLINLAHELGWITKPTKDISGILREYRNYIHPHKEYANNVTISLGDTQMFWELLKSITRQLIGTT